jgi:sodium-coupled monocarboxylate transporter 8/12
MWYSACGCLTVIVVGLIVSAFTGIQDPRKLNPSLICNVGNNMYWFLPKKAKEVMKVIVKFIKSISIIQVSVTSTVFTIPCWRRLRKFYLIIRGESENESNKLLIWSLLMWQVPEIKKKPEEKVGEINIAFSSSNPDDLQTITNTKRTSNSHTDTE